VEGDLFVGRPRLRAENESADCAAGGQSFAVSDHSILKRAPSVGLQTGEIARAVLIGQ
jgi:hypothetical protein